MKSWVRGGARDQLESLVAHARYWRHILFLMTAHLFDPPVLHLLCKPSPSLFNVSCRSVLPHNIFLYQTWPKYKYTITLDCQKSVILVPAFLKHNDSTAVSNTYSPLNWRTLRKWQNPLAISIIHKSLRTVSMSTHLSSCRMHVSCSSSSSYIFYRHLSRLLLVLPLLICPNEWLHNPHVI